MDQTDRYTSVDRQIAFASRNHVEPKLAQTRSRSPHQVFDRKSLEDLSKDRDIKRGNGH